MENEKIHELNPEIFHIIEIIDTHLEKFKDSLRKIPCKVTAHFPCHLNRGMSVDCETIFENVLNIIPGVEYIPMVDPDTCCGGSGGVNTAFPDIAKKIREQKLKNIIDTGPQICVTACPLCETFLGEGLRSMGSKIVVLSLPFFVGLAFKDFKERLEEFLPRKKKGG
jgi:glycolate oxidase iron-sulfur subunit